MTNRADEDQAILDRGTLWQEFKRSVFYDHLIGYIRTQEKALREDCCEKTMAGDYEGAKMSAHRAAGLLEIVDYIEGCIADKLTFLEEEAEEKDERRSVPRHV